MNYNTYKTHAFTVEKLGLDINGNTRRKLTFYKMVYGEMQQYKTAITNEQIEHLTNDRVIEVWG